jgi:hypothetical protein
MTWEELCEKAKEMGYDYASFKDDEWLSKNRLTFTKDGCLFCVGTIFAESRAPSQMYQIMKALQ